MVRALIINKAYWFTKKIKFFLKKKPPKCNCPECACSSMLRVSSYFHFPRVNAKEQRRGPTIQAFGGEIGRGAGCLRQQVGQIGPNRADNIKLKRTSARSETLCRASLVGSVAEAAAEVVSDSSIIIFSF